MDTFGKPRHPYAAKPIFVQREIAMFDTERFVADCRAAFAADQSHKAIHEVVARAMSEPAAVFKGLAIDAYRRKGRRHRNRRGGS